MTDRPKKSDKLEVRLPFDTKRAFVERCRNEGQSVSETIRRLIEAYMAQAFQMKEQPMRLIPPAAIAAIAAGVAAIAIFAATPGQAAGDLKAAFDNLDQNHDGLVTMAEFRSAPNAPPPAVSSTPKPGAVAGTASISGAPTRMDVNGDGGVSFSEFEAYNRAAIREQFLAWDADNNGKITLAEIRDASHDGQGGGFNTTGALDGLFAKLDANKDGAVSQSEFQAAL